MGHLQLVHKSSVILILRSHVSDQLTDSSELVWVSETINIQNSLQELADNLEVPFEIGLNLRRCALSNPNQNCHILFKESVSQILAKLLGIRVILVLLQVLCTHHSCQIHDRNRFL